MCWRWLLLAWIGIKPAVQLPRCVLVQPTMGDTDLVSQDPTDAANRWYVELVADPVCQKFVTDLPSEDPRVFLLQLADVVDDFWCGDPGFAAPYGPGEDGACIVEAG